MCDRSKENVKAALRTSPEDALADLLNTDLGTSLKPREVRLFVLANWKRICRHAHEIHDAAE